MAATVVLIFLLDNLTEHPNNVTNNVYDKYQDHINVQHQQCNARIAEPLVQLAGEQLTNLTYINTDSRQDSEMTFPLENANDFGFENDSIDDQEEEGFSSVEYEPLVDNSQPQFKNPYENNDQNVIFGLINAKKTLKNNDGNDTSNSRNRNNSTNSIDNNSASNKDIGHDNNFTINNIPHNHEETLSTSNNVIENCTRKNINTVNVYEYYDDTPIIEEDTTFNKKSNKSIESSESDSANNLNKTKGTNVITITINDNIYDVITNESMEYSTIKIPFESNTNKAIETSKDIIFENGATGAVKEVGSGPAPYLVAIFESLANVTAQTCAGALVASEWVLTAASCINVLGSLYDSTDANSTYTVIVNASNPLFEGSAHRVTEIHFHPQSLSQPESSTPTPIEAVDQPVVALKAVDPVVALMRFEPKVETGVMRIGAVAGGEKVMVYGWALNKSESGGGQTHATSFPAVTLTSFERRLLGHSDNNTLFLATTNFDSQMPSDVHFQMTSGGPVVGMTSDGPRLLALVMNEVRAPMVAAPLAAHARWIGDILNH